ncbi:hypothetical protein [Tateyamaria sp. ANG-S1]|uniref:hypothetical protein n=1 Tax=Tateyamaria sp. ANG-S1 TaxID=1577905 RepID=UPI00057F47DC|nr:hypothetical protein [Tateyamaria sp. ANG-S1]KIC47686.1 hypothetical protein RA29_19370 [Tateyamaria sp. ANG-S1]
MTTIEAASPPDMKTMLFVGLRPIASGYCPCCGAECHAVFEIEGKNVLIERWSIATTVLLLTDRSLLPKLPSKWYFEWEHYFEQVRETGRCHVTGTAGEVGRV